MIKVKYFMQYIHFFRDANHFHCYFFVPYAFKISSFVKIKIIISVIFQIENIFRKRNIVSIRQNGTSSFGSATLNLINLQEQNIYLFCCSV
jgi:hypothetical protein